MPTAPLRRRTLQRALAIVGSRAALARKLRVPRDELASWLKGDDVPPTAVFLGAVDIVVQALDADLSPCGPLRAYASEGVRPSA